MNIVSCPNGHYFNKDKYPVCPICSAPVLTLLPQIDEKDIVIHNSNGKIDPRETSMIPPERQYQVDTLLADEEFQKGTTCLSTSTQSTITDNSYRSKGEE